MTAPVTGNPLSQMLNNAFTKLDRDGDNKLNADEFADFNQVLMPGLKLDDNGKPTVDMSPSSAASTAPRSDDSSQG